MSRKTLFALALLVLSPLVVYFLWPSDENRIKKLFREGAEAVGHEKIDGVMSKISFSYTDDQGLAYITIKKGLERAFNQMSGIKIEYKIIDIRVKDPTASVDLDIRAIANYGQETGYIMGDAVTPARVKVFLEKERTSWLITRTEGLYHP